MRVAMIGQRGLPATHGGVERHVQELSSRLAASGHEVTVFTRPAYTDPALHEHEGVRLVSLPTIGTKHLDAIVHSLLCSFGVWRGGYDVVHYHSAGPCLTAPLARLRGRKVVVTLHGQDWRRAKWGRFASLMLRAGEWIALRVPHATISVSSLLAEEYAGQGARRVVHVPNGVVVEEGPDDTAYLREAGLAGEPYVLWVGRLVPEKGVHTLIDAWEAASRPAGLVIAGDTSHSDAYVRSLRERGEGAVFTGYVYGGRLATLFRNAALFVLPSELEGLPIVLLEALAYGTPVLCSDIPPNVEILGEQGRYFRAGDAGDLAAKLTEALRSAGELKGEAMARRARVAAGYDWASVARRTEDVYRAVLAGRAARDRA